MQNMCAGGEMARMQYMDTFFAFNTGEFVELTVLWMSDVFSKILKINVASSV